MAETLLTVVADLVAKPGKEEDLKRQLLALVDPTRREEGCVQYDLHQSTDEPARFVFYENWTSRGALDRHLQSAHITAFRQLATELLAEPPRILTYTRIA
ncbi:MAG: putative quinol monooxygenase [Bryobacteraceae bacterium]